MNATVAAHHAATACLNHTFATACRHLHEQEIALHDARQTGVEGWIQRAETRLHDAIGEYEAARTAMSRLTPA